MPSKELPLEDFFAAVFLGFDRQILSVPPRRANGAGEAVNAVVRATKDRIPASSALPATGVSSIWLSRPIQGPTGIGKTMMLLRCLALGAMLGAAAAAAADPVHNLSATSTARIEVTQNGTVVMQARNVRLLPYTLLDGEKHRPRLA